MAHGEGLVGFVEVVCQLADKGSCIVDVDVCEDEAGNDKQAEQEGPGSCKLEDMAKSLVFPVRDCFSSLGGFVECTREKEVGVFVGLGGLSGGLFGRHGWVLEICCIESRPGQVSLRDEESWVVEGVVRKQIRTAATAVLRTY